MNLSQNTQIILLLTGYFSPSSTTTTKPLTVGEWARFAGYLKSNKIQPSQLLDSDYQILLDSFTDKTITLERVNALLKRGTAMAVALEKWSRASIWVMSRADEEYPERLKKKLGQNSPPILYGCGNKMLLKKGGIGVVGSRSVSDQDISYTYELGRKVAEAGFSIVSGGAKGVDQTAMSAALEAEGTVIGVMADGLFRACASRRYRQYLMNNNLVLITPFYPEAGFNAGNAMQRNKYIYCLSNSTVAVHSGKPDGRKKGGGTWTGALENLKKGWVPLWVKQTDDVKAGNALIAKAGAHWLSADIQNVQIEGLLQESSHQVPPVKDDLFSKPQGGVVKTETKIETDGVGEYEQIRESLSVEYQVGTKTELPVLEPLAYKNIEDSVSSHTPETFYEFFLIGVKPLLQEEKTVDELVEALEVNKTQLNVWLKMAVEDMKLSKLKRPVRYQWLSERNIQNHFFDENLHP